MPPGLVVVVFVLGSASTSFAVVFGIAFVTGLPVAFGLNHVSPI